MIARPARVRIRSRKPCVRARRRLFGWKVRLPLLTVDSPGRRRGTVPAAGLFGAGRWCGVGGAGPRGRRTAIALVRDDARRALMGTRPSADTVDFRVRSAARGGQTAPDTTIGGTVGCTA